MLSKLEDTFPFGSNIITVRRELMRKILQIAFALVAAFVVIDISRTVKYSLIMESGGIIPMIIEILILFAFMFLIAFIEES